MKYYHVIYNSSQRTQNNSVGLGVRTYTVGTPAEYLDALKSAGLFSYSSGNMPQPNAQNLFKDGSLIEKLPVSYCYTKILVPATGKDIYVISRTVSVGFDYPYYLKNSVARLDNFVLDAYIFEEYPGEETMEVLYGDPAEGSVCFVPKSAAPSPQNEEMKNLSVGHADLLPVEELSFRANGLKAVSLQSFDLLFAYIEATRQNQPLFVKCEATLAPVLMADLMRLLPNHLEENATFCANYQEEGWRDGFQIFFINETYRYDVASQDGLMILDLSAGETAQSIEAKSYKEEVINLVQTNNQIELDKLLAWMLNPVYSKIRENSDSVKKILYNYTIEPEIFQISDLKINRDELWPVLLDYFSLKKDNQSLFNSKLKAELSSQMSDDKFFPMLSFCNTLISAGFQLGDVISDCKKTISTRLLASEDTFLSAINIFSGVAPIEKYFEKSIFEAKGKYLDNNLFTEYWPTIFQFFCSESEMNPSSLVSRMFRNKLAKSTRDEVLQKINISQNELLRISIDSLDASTAEYAWEHIEEILVNQIQSDNLLLDAKDAEKISSQIITPMSNIRDFGEWPALLDLIQERITVNNVQGICEWAFRLKKCKYLSLLINKGIGLMNYAQLKSLVSEVKQMNLDITPEHLINRMSAHKQFVDIAADILVVYGVKKKTFLKHVKDGRYDKIEEQNVSDILLQAYGLEKVGLWESLRNSVPLPIFVLIVSVFVLLVAFTLFVGYLFLEESLDGNSELEPIVNAISSDTCSCAVADDSIALVAADSVMLDSLDNKL